MTRAQDRGIRYSVVVPVYRNEGSLPEVLARLAALAADREGDLEGVFVVDGSPDGSHDLLRSLLPGAGIHSQLIGLSRNFGAFSAIRVGLEAARGEYVAVMAADLQEPVEVVARIFDALESGSCDIAIGQRTGRDDPAVSAFASRMYWGLYRRFINREIPAGGVDIFGCVGPVAHQLASFPETHTSLVGLLYWMGYRRSCVPYHRAASASGQSGWTFRRKLRYMFDSIYAFTDLPILLLQFVGGLGIIVSVLIGLFVFVAWALGMIHEPGYTPVMITILASTSALLLALGVVGTYVWRTYENGKQRPRDIIAAHQSFGHDEEGE